MAKIISKDYLLESETYEAVKDACIRRLRIFIRSVAPIIRLRAISPKQFLPLCQNKLHFAITGKTAAEIVHDRVSSSKQNLGLTTWKNSPKGKIRETDVVIAKNYLNETELDELNRIVEMYLIFAESQARRGKNYVYERLGRKVGKFLQFNERTILQDLGKVSHEVAEALALEEYEKYNANQDKITFPTLTGK